MQRYRLSFLLVGGQEVHSSWFEMDDAELETMRDMVKEHLRSNGDGYFSIDPFENVAGQKVEYMFRIENVAGVRITHE